MSLLELNKIGSVVRFAQDDFIVSEGESGDCMYIILDGQADVYLSSFDDLPIKVHEIKKGDFFGEMALLESMPRSATIIAAQNTVAIKIDQSNFQTLLENRSDIVMRMLRTLSARLRKTNEELLVVKSGHYEMNNKTVDLTNCFEEHSCEELPIEECSPKEGGLYQFDPDSDENIQVLDLLPDNHSAYKLKLYQEDYSENILEKEVICPLCQNEFKVDLIRTSKLMMQKQEPLFRKKYSNMNALASNIWTCPHCYYSQYFYNFHVIPVYKKEPLKELLRRIKPSIQVHNNQLDDINIIFVKYFLAAFIEENTRGINMINMGKFWLNLYWLYSDVNDKNMSKMALEKAHHYYKEAYYNSRLRLSDEEELRLGVLVAELFTLNNELKNAYNLLAKLIVNKKMPSQLKQYASNLMYETKLSIKATQA